MDNDQFNRILDSFKVKKDVDEHYVNALNLISRRIFDAGKTLESIDRSLQKIAEPDAIITFPEDR